MIFFFLIVRMRPLGYTDVVWNFVYVPNNAYVGENDDSFNFNDCSHLITEVREAKTEGTHEVVNNSPGR